MLRSSPSRSSSERLAPRAIFCANAGRTGSQYLAGLFEHAVGVASFHEPEPQLVGEALRDDPSLLEAAIDAKVQAIVRATELAGASIYAETSNAFVKTAPLALIDALGWTVEVPVLRRDLGQQVMSFLRLGFFSFSGQEVAWMDWMPVSGLAGNLTSLPSGVKGDQLDRIIAYLIEVEARIRKMSVDRPALRLHHVALDDLLSVRGVLDLFDRLNLAPRASLVEVIGIPRNRRGDRSGDTAVRENEIQERIASYGAALMAEGRTSELYCLHNLCSEPC